MPFRLPALLLALLLGGCAGTVEAGRDLPPAAVMRPVDLWRAEPGRRDVGALELLAGFELRGGREGFGGFSGIRLADGRLLLLSDRGWLWQARPVLADDGTLLGLEDWQGERLRIAGSGGAPDTEELVLGAGGEPSFFLERVHAIATRPANATGPATAVPLPPPLDAAPSNEGIEAAARLADGRLLVLSEGQRRADGAQLAAVLGGDRPVLLGYRPAPGFRPTGAARLGRWLFVVERRVSLLAGLEGRIAAVDLEAQPPRAGAVLEGRELARLGGRTISDNLEAILALPGPDGAVHLLVVSDDNFSALQRTLLLQLLWRP